MSAETWESIEIDEEWMELISKARGMGLTVEEIRQFFQETLSGSGPVKR
ncbi:anti-repressor SinI family protein [Paenibacillus sp. CC-CFT747]|nr:anti-repressor SinI family protein [Paenibacillus sp. CC-CFT747]